MAVVTSTRSGHASATASPSRRLSVITLIFLSPIYWITSTAFKPRNLATTVPPTVVFQPEVTPFVKLFTKRVQLTAGDAGSL
jgi:multiple sugar transport system permease protein